MLLVFALNAFNFYMCDLYLKKKAVVKFKKKKS